MNLLTLWAQHRLIGVAVSSGLLGGARLHFLPAIGATILDDWHGKDFSSDFQKESNANSDEKVRAGQWSSQRCVVLLLFLLLGSDEFE